MKYNPIKIDKLDIETKDWSTDTITCIVRVKMWDIIVERYANAADAEYKVEFEVEDAMAPVVGNIIERIDFMLGIGNVWW